MGKCSVYEHIVCPNEKYYWADNMATLFNISCAEHLKRKSRCRSGCWGPGEGSTAPTRRPWQSTAGAKRSLGTLKLEVEFTSNQARMGQGLTIFYDKFKSLIIPRTKESLVAGSKRAGGHPMESGKMYWSKYIQKEVTINNTIM